MNYNLDLDRLVTWLLPSTLRKPKILSFLKAAIMPIKTLYAIFLVEGKVMLNEARMAPQTAKLERLLNTSLDGNGGRITIVHPQLYHISVSDARILFITDLTPLIIQDNNISSLVDFHVKIPADFAKSYQMILRGEFDNNLPLSISDSNHFFLSDSKNVLIYSIYDETKPFTLSDYIAAIIHDVEDIKTTVQITAILEKYKLAGKRFSLSI